jgi:methylmalonyl-CoA/ethylmalonyl-CoA epimerase
MTMTSGDVNLEIFEPVDAKGEMAKFLNEKGGGLYHVALNTDDIEKDMQSFKSKGVKLGSDKPMVMGPTKIAFATAETPEKLSIEMVQRG